MNKTEVYSWRLSPELKTALEEAARDEDTSVAELLERAAREWLARTSSGKRTAEEVEQRRLRAAAMQFVGTIAGGDPRRAGGARTRIRNRLRKRRGR